MILGRDLQRGTLRGDVLPRSVLHLWLCLTVLAAVATAASPELRVGSLGPGVSGLETERQNRTDVASIGRASVAESVGEASAQAMAQVEAAADSGPDTPGFRLQTPDSGLAGRTKITTSTYTVQPGDSLADIAQQFGIDVPTLLGSNDLDDPDLLPTGLELKVLPIRGVLHRVAEGDTLNRIAERYELVVRDIMRANDIADSELIAVGDQLVLPGARPLVRAPVEADPAPTGAAEPAPQARVEQPRTELASAVVLPPATAARPSFVWPAGGPITTYFGQVGWTSPRGHAGLDIAAPWGAPVRAAAGGRVIVATRAGGAYGVQVIIDHGNGLRTVYGHLSELHVGTGEQVERGEQIGLVGSTGFSTGPHLHFEIRQNGELRDPLRFLP